MFYGLLEDFLFDDLDVTSYIGYMKKRNFEYTAGSLALNFIDTVSRREQEPIELLTSVSDFKVWLKGTELKIVNSFELSENELDFAKKLREAIYRIIKSTLTKSDLNPEDLKLLNKSAAMPTARPQLNNGVVIYHSKDPFRAIMSEIAEDAIVSISQSGSKKLRQCPDCKMIFKDNSRPQKRIWCSSSSGCGNRAKVRRHRSIKEK